MNYKSNPKLLCLILLFVSTFLVYGQITGNEFINFDDELYITNNPWVKNGLTMDGMIWAFDLDYKDGLYWHPLAWLSHMADVELFGLNPGGHHFVSMMFHIICSMLLFLTLNLMTGSIWKSFFAASMFAVHPLNVDTVAWAAERKNLLSTLFWMLTVLSYIYYASRPNFIKYLLVIIVFLLGILSKPMLVTLPCALLLLDYWPLRRFQWASFNVKSLPQFHQSPTVVLIAEKLPLLGISTIATILVSRSLGNDFISFGELPLLLRIENALVSYVAYLVKVIYPMNLTIFYPFPQSLPLWQPLLSGVILAVITSAAIFLRNKAAYFIVGWLWFLGTLVPVIGIVQAGLWPAMADRWGYVPLIGVFMIISWGIPHLFYVFFENSKTFLLIAGSTIVLIFYMTVAFFQTGHWKNSTTLFSHAQEISGPNFIALNNLGTAALAAGKTNQAKEYFLKAIEAKPDYMKSKINLGDIMAENNDYENALKFYNSALLIDPYNVSLLMRIGNLNSEAGNMESAIHYYLNALELSPADIEILINLGLIYSKSDDHTKAIAYFKKALKRDPDSFNIHNLLACEFFRTGDFDKAIIHYYKALEINPEDARLNYNMAVAQYLKGNITIAIRYAKKALTISPDYTKAKVILEKFKTPENKN